MSDAIQAIVMPKWGLAMQEGMLTDWLVDEGAQINPGMEICDIESSKITSAMESTVAGTLVRRVAEPGVTLPVGALLGVVINGDVAAADIDAFISKFEEEFAVAAAAASDEGPKAKTIQLGDYNINYLQMGEGEALPMLFVHGFGGDLNNWLFNQPGVAEQRPTYALDLPGHGGSSKTIKDASIAGLATLVGQFMDAVGISKAHLVGHSMGGAIVSVLAQQQADKAASLTLVASAGLGPEINMDYITGFINGGSRKEMKPVLQNLFADESLVTRDMINDILKYKRLDGVTEALNTLANTVFSDGQQSGQVREELATLDIPIQAIVGNQDKIIPARHNDGLSDNIAVHRFDNAGHMPHMEVAAETNRLLDAIA